MLWLFGIILSWDGDGKFGEENQDLIKWGWGNYQVVGYSNSHVFLGAAAPL